jgi:3-phenylpropionate/trans-cinnamate dioxygenase ferredoxin subunit
MSPGQTRYCALDSGPVLPANFEGFIYALSGICPPQLNPLDGAMLWGPLIDCPFHHFQYDCRRGENYFPCNVYPQDLQHLRKQLGPLKRYVVRIEEGEIWVDVQ